MGPKELSAEEVTFRFAEEEIAELLSENSTGEIIGQPRGLRALKIGTEIRARGYNILVTGLSGTGRYTAVRQVLQDYRADRSLLRDIAFVYNFRKPDNPRVLYFAAGQAGEFKKATHQLVENLKTLVPARLESDAFKRQRDRILQRIEEQEARVLGNLEQRLADDSFRIIQIQEGEGEAADIVPIYNGRETDFDELKSLAASGEISEEDLKQTRERYYLYIDEMKRTFQDLRLARDKAEQRLDAAKEETVRPLIQAEVDHVAQQFTGEKVQQYLRDVQIDILANLYIFTLGRPVTDQSGNPALIRYGVNVILDNANTERAPVIFQNHPTYAHLFGTVESHFEMSGESRTSFMMIRAGSLIQACGGFLVVSADDILQDEDVWHGLKRALQIEQVEIHPALGPFRTPGPLIKPEPVEINAKVIIVGGESLYDLLYHYDEEFYKYFKISAEFDTVMDRTPHSTRGYLGYLRGVVERESLRDLRPDGMAALVEYGVRVAEQRNKLTTRFSLITDILREANYWAGEQGQEAITRSAVEQALQERRFLHSLPEEKIDEEVVSGELIIRLTGSEVGRVNGLAVHDRGYYAFGRPTVISARVSPGDDGVINIERESGLSGEIHDKGIFILEGFLRSTFARDFPLSITASVCFEQSYIEVDGDSASSSEVYALLSAIVNVPVRQDIAVTGSVSQTGEVQAIGGATEKVEGFYDICRKSGLTGNQGVIIPQQSCNSLILSREVEQAVASGSFHVYSVSTVNDGIEILTGMQAGVRNKRGEYPQGTFNHLVERRLKEMASRLKAYSGS